MSTQVIMRPVFNRPEMLKLSIDYEIAAREYYSIDCEFLTVFVVEYGATSKVLELVESYPYNKTIVKRKHNFGLSKNILDGFKISFPFADDWLVYLEDDILLHKTYFQYIDVVLNMQELSNYSVISPYNFDDEGSVNKVRKDRHYAALGPLISRYFYYTYLEPCSNESFYNDPVNFVCKLNDLYKEYQHDRTYRYRNAQHFAQAGLCNRLMDVARIEEGKYVVMPEVNRIQHIGIYGYNRPGGKLNGSTFDERLADLKSVIKDPKLMYDRSATKQYNDYKAFSPKLDNWDGTLQLADKHFIS